MKRYEKLLGKFYLVEPILESLVKKCPNPKICAEKAGKEYSNFLKGCRLSNNFELKNFVQTAGALERDTILFTLPKGFVEEYVKSPPRYHHWYQIISYFDLIQLFKEIMRSQEGEEQIDLLSKISLESLKSFRKQLDNIIDEIEMDYGDRKTDDDSTPGTGE